MVREKKRGPKLTSSAQADFKRRKFKVGRTVKKSVTDTDTSFKAKSLQMPAQRLHATDSGDDDDSDGAEAAPTTTRRLTLPELITHLNHHNATVRKDALVGLRSLWIAYPTAVHAKMSAVIDAIGHRLADEDFDVRSTMYTLLESVAHSELLPSAVLQPFYKLLCIYLKGALSSIHHPIRMDALAFLAIFARGYPALVQCEGTQLLAALTPLLALSQHAMVTSTICHNIMPASLKLGKAGASTIQKACPRAKLSSQEARLVVAGAVTLVTLALLPSPHSAHSDDAIVDVASVAVRTLSTFNKSDADVSLPVTPVLTWTAAGSNASLLFRPLPASASAAFITSTSAALSSTSLMFTPDQTLGALVDLLAELDPASAHAASKYVVARMCTCMSALGAWWLYEVQTCGKPTLAWTAALFAGLERTVLPHFPFESSDIMTEAGSQHLAGLNVRACLLLTMCLPPHSLHDAAMTNALAERTHVKGCKLSFHWIPAVVAVLKETLEGSHSDPDVLITGLLVLQMLLPFLRPEERTRLLQAFTTLYSRSHKGSSVKRKCIEFMANTLLHTHDVSVPEDVMSTWLASFPKLLWLLGSECAATTSAVLQIMLRMAHRGCIGDDEVRAKMVRSCIPLLGATKRVVDIEAAHALPICFGPFIAWEPTSQRLFLAFLTVMNFWPWQLLRGIAAVFSHASLVASMRADVLRAPLLSMATCCPSHSPSVCGQQCQDIADFIMCCLLHSDELVQRVCPPTGSEPALTYATWAPGVECADSDLALHELVADAVRTFPACSTLLGRIVLLLRSVSLQSLSTSGLFAVCALLNALRQFSAGLADDVPALLCAFVDHNAAVLVPALIRTSADTPEVRAHRLCRAMLSAYPTCVASVLGSLSFAIVREDVSTSALTDTKNFLSIDGIRAIISSHVTELTAMYNTASCLAARLDAVGVIAASVKAMLQSYLRV